MIEKYIIKHENKGDILYLYLNYNYEFGSFNNGKSFFKELKNILNNNLINFKGNKIVLIASGIIIGTILLSNINYKQDEYSKYLDNTKYISQVVLNDFNNEDEFVINTSNSDAINNTDEDIIEKDEDVINNTDEDIIDNKDVNIINNYLTKEEPKDNNELVINTTNNIEKNVDNDINTNTDIEDINNNEDESINNEINIEDYKTMVTVYRSNGDILDIELEEYLIGVVAGEMPASFNMEALKVQAIIARTYALKSIQKNKKLTDTTSTQVYIDKSEMYYKWEKDFNKYYNKIKEAVNSTKDMVITYNDELIEAVYFANSNGYTENAKEVWGYDIPYLKSVESPFDLNTTRYKKKITKSFEEVSNILCFNIDSNVNIDDIVRNNSNRVISITINNKTYTGIEFRNLFNLNSTDFEIEITDDSFIFTTYGYGHGVGVSQYGANGMANNGYSYEDIIKYYYKNVNIKKDYNL